jgi:hypothetical protein
MGGAAVAYWRPIAEHYGLDLTVVNPAVDPAFAFMTLDHDGKIRMDCSSPYAMAGLVALKDRFDIAWGNDADVDRHGIVTPSLGLMNPNHYLAVAIDYLLAHRPQWPATAAVGKTLVSSGIDRPRRRRAGPPPARSPGRLQVVLGRPARRQHLLRRRGERRRQLPAPRRQRPGPPTRTASSSACSPPKSPPSPARTPVAHYLDLAARYGAPVLRAHRRPGQPGGKGRFQAVDRGTRERRHARRRTHRRPPDARRRQRCADRRAQGGRPKTAGSPPVRRAPRISTRSTPRASRAPRTCSRSWPRRRRSFRGRWRGEGSLQATEVLGREWRVGVRRTGAGSANSAPRSSIMGSWSMLFGRRSICRLSSREDVRFVFSAQRITCKRNSRMLGHKPSEKPRLALRFRCETRCLVPVAVVGRRVAGLSSGLS